SRDSGSSVQAVDCGGPRYSCWPLRLWARVAMDHESFSLHYLTFRMRHRSDTSLATRISSRSDEPPPLAPAVRHVGLRQVSDLQYLRVPAERCRPCPAVPAHPARGAGACGDCVVTVCRSRRHVPLDAADLPVPNRALTR